MITKLTQAQEKKMDEYRDEGWVDDPKIKEVQKEIAREQSCKCGCNSVERSVDPLEKVAQKILYTPIERDRYIHRLVLDVEELKRKVDELEYNETQRWLDRPIGE